MGNIDPISGVHMSKHLLIAVAIAITSVTTVSHAQTSVDERIRRFRIQKIQMVEEVLLKRTSKTATVVYLRELEFGLPSPGFCGEAIVGSRERNKFVIDLNKPSMRVGLTPQEWAELSCGSMEGETLVDVR